VTSGIAAASSPTSDVAIAGLLIEKASAAGFSDFDWILLTYSTGCSVLHHLCLLVRSVGAVAGVGGCDWRHVRAGDRRGRLCPGAARAARHRQIAALLFTPAGVALAAQS
jgi:hypothetical protein